MDILIHGASGLLAGSVAVHASQARGVKRKLWILFTGLLAGVLPDLDVLSMWSGFDGTFGKWFGLQESGREIFRGKHWYSHHGFSHSIVCAALLSVSILGIRQMVFRNNKGTARMYALTFFGGYMAHLLGDLPTPPGAWGGIRLFYPLDQYVGGFAWTFWWNNYDVFLLILSGIAVNLLLLVVRKRLTVLQNWKWAGAVVALTFALCTFQLATRGEPFIYERHTGQYANQEQRSLDIQRSILGERLYKAMWWFDQRVPLNF
ncbi:MAG: metal-dependent hydrolase [Flavobacteriales bacterium]|nr:metal-dependent hydrolase [Flavobacteriales bacterium]